MGGGTCPTPSAPEPNISYDEDDNPDDDDGGGGFGGLFGGYLDIPDDTYAPPVVVTYEIPKGTRGIYLSTSKQSRVPTEYEWLMPANSAWRMTRKQQDPETNTYHVTLALVTQRDLDGTVVYESPKEELRRHREERQPSLPSTRPPPPTFGGHRSRPRRPMT